jgi:cytochrome b involved in lipid metabolism
MGWLKPTSFLTSRTRREITGDSHYNHDTTKDDLVKLDDTLAQHLEAVEIHSGNNNSHYPSLPIQSIDLEDSDLPFIPSAIVRSAKNSLGRTWVVVDNIVYDCTDFAHEHPGGETVINSFSGQDCSWQFWRFHNSTHMRESGRPLRVGRTSGIKNRFAERPRFVGLRRKDEW